MVALQGHHVWSSARASFADARRAIICGCPIQVRVRAVGATLVVARYEAEDWNFGGISYFLPALTRIVMYLAATFSYFLAQE